MAAVPEFSVEKAKLKESLIASGLTSEERQAAYIELYSALAEAKSAVDAEVASGTCDAKDAIEAAVLMKNAMGSDDGIMTGGAKISELVGAVCKKIGEGVDVLGTKITAALDAKKAEIEAITPEAAADAITKSLAGTAGAIALFDVKRNGWNGVVGHITWFSVKALSIAVPSVISSVGTAIGALEVGVGAAAAATPAALNVATTYLLYKSVRSAAEAAVQAKVAAGEIDLKTADGWKKVVEITKNAVAAGGKPTGDLFTAFSAATSVAGEYLKHFEEEILPSLLASQAEEVRVAGDVPIGPAAADVVPAAVVADAIAAAPAPAAEPEVVPAPMEDVSQPPSPSQAAAPVRPKRELSPDEEVGEVSRGRKKTRMGGKSKRRHLKTHRKHRKQTKKAAPKKKGTRRH